MKLTVRRTTRGDCYPTVSRTIDAIRPLAEAVERLDRSLDRAAERVEAARRADRRRKLETMVADVARNIYADIERDRRQEERDAFQRKLFGARLPRTFRERVFGVPDEESKP